MLGMHNTNLITGIGLRVTTVVYVAFSLLAVCVYGLEFQQCNIIQWSHLALLAVIARNNKQT